ncbi:MAG TPA: acyltransferase [Firmicutes bacterium]|nr:acyltransferase [Bacillota bacterium]
MERPHIGEVDYLRVLGLSTIVLLHTWGFYLLMPVASPYSRVAQELGINLLRFGRQLFMFVTGMVVFYNYGGRKMNVGRFFARRLNNLIIPYVIWTAFYLFLKRLSHLVAWSDFKGFATLWLQNVLNGNGYMHLYYVLVAVQFYLLVPWLVSRFRFRRPGRAAKAILGLGLILYAVYYYLFETRQSVVVAAVAGTPLQAAVGWSLLYKDRLLFSYFPYYLLGALAGLNMESWRRWLRDHFRAVLVFLVLATGLVTGEYFYCYRYHGGSWALTISVFKPSIYLYTLAVVATLFQLSLCLERRGSLRWLVSPLAANSLGIYLLHPAVLFVCNSYFWKYMHLPGFLLALLEPAGVILVSAITSALLGGNRYTRFIVGEAGNLRYSFPWGRLRALGFSPPV